MFEELRRAFPSRLEDMDVFSNLLYLQDSKDKLCVLALECDKIDKYRPETCCVRGKPLKFDEKIYAMLKKYHL